MYIKRSLEAAIKEASKHFRVILLTGPRQVGKTTILERIKEKTRSYVSFDDVNNQVAAQQDPAGFLDRLTLPVLLDEVQYVPELFPYIKLIVDKLKKPGLFWLTGSQQFDMMKNISESLVGRVAILKLSGISLAEEQQRINGESFLPDIKVLRQRQKTAKKIGILELYHKIWRGSYPDIVLDDGKHWERFYESYLTTYIQRDVKDYLQINNQAAFQKFMQIAAARTGQLINYREISQDVGVSEPTIKSWFMVLQASGIVFLLTPYFNNQTKRLLKTPKLYFMDTGLCCFLTGWLNSQVLERGAMAGAILETYVISEVIKSYINNGHTPRIYFYRDKEKREIDLLIEKNGMLYPIEIKKTATISHLKLGAFKVLQNLNLPIGHGGVLCLVEGLLPLDKNIDAIPIAYI